MKLKFILESMREQEKPSMEDIPKEEKKKLIEVIKTFTELKKHLMREIRLTELSHKIKNISSSAKRLIENERGDWFSKQSISEDMKLLEKYSIEFEKISKTLDENNLRAEALYDNMNKILERYFYMEKK